MTKFNEIVEDIKFEKSAMLKQGKYIFNDKVLRLLAELK